ncbi:hypothetical protein [Amycolatopsis methanolica]|uniref:hypothetical protein n=1 Tax=Amycolatopsis methanolica TaxID=1814 RepID=UPI000AE629BA|nr:hypothetical protein [Amycolatopsis methanolica]
MNLSPEDRRRRAHEALDRLHERVLAHDMDGFAPGGVMEFPFAPPGWPVLRDREAVREVRA